MRSPGATAPSTTEQLRPWLANIANRAETDDRGLGFVNSLSRQARLNANVLMLGLKPTTALIDGVSALSNSIREVGAGNFSSAVADFFRNPDGMRRQWAWANEMSGELRHRGHNLDRDMNAVLDTWSGAGPAVGFASARQHFALYRDEPDCDTRQAVGGADVGSRL
jgi:hypothetical protein